MKNAIEVTHLKKSFPGFTLEDISFTLPEGTILGLVGENGAGKSTTIRLLLNTLSPDSGTRQVLDCDVSSPAYAKIRNQIGVVLDESYFPEVLNALQVGKILKKAFSEWNEELYQRYLNRFSLPKDKAFKDYSRGMRMKLSIAAALSHNPRLLILDEATSGLDPMIRDEIIDIFYEFTRDPSHSILISSHIISDLEKLCDYIGFLHQGKLMLFEEKDRLLEEYGVAHLSPEEARTLPKEAVKGARKNPYGVDVLLDLAKAPSELKTDRTTLEEIILMIAKGGQTL